jgi:hypothetical protein
LDSDHLTVCSGMVVAMRERSLTAALGVPVVPSMPWVRLRPPRSARPKGPPAWLLALIFVCTSGGMLLITSTFVRTMRQPAGAGQPLPELGPSATLCNPACNPPTYCDSSTGKCVADAALADNPVPRRIGTEDRR